MKETIIITAKKIEIKGRLARHKIVKKVVNSFIATEYRKKGKGVKFRYPVESLPHGNLFIVRPGYKKNFDFHVEPPVGMELGRGFHYEIALDLRNKKKENPKKFKNLLNAIIDIYNCSENDVNKILSKYTGIKRSFKTGAKVEIFLKVLKWLFIMEDILYWDVEGRAFLFNLLFYVAHESNAKRLKEVLAKVKNKKIMPDRLRSYMRNCGIEWKRCIK
jgi:hypothetical protein